MPKAQLFVRRKSDRRADLCKVGSRSRLYRNAEIDGIDQHKAVATERRVDPHRTNTGNVEFYVKTIGEGRKVPYGDALDLAGTALGANGDESAGGFDRELGDRFDHRHPSGLEQDRGDTHRVTSRHRWRVTRLHDDETSDRLGRYRWYEQIDVAEHATPRFVENEVPKGLVSVDPPRLCPK